MEDALCRSLIGWVPGLTAEAGCCDVLLQSTLTRWLPSSLQHDGCEGTVKVALTHWTCFGKKGGANKDVVMVAFNSVRLTLVLCQ